MASTRPVKVHLIVRVGFKHVDVACGNLDPRRRTHEPKLVTCDPCTRAMKMAEREIADRQSAKR